MATMNPFDLLGDNAEDPSQFIAAEQEEVVVAVSKKAGAQDHGKSGARSQPQQQIKVAQMPTKPPPPAEAVREQEMTPIGEAVVVDEEVGVDITTEHNDHQSHEEILSIRSSNQMSRLRDTIRDHLVRDM